MGAGAAHPPRRIPRCPPGEHWWGALFLHTDRLQVTGPPCIRGHPLQWPPLPKPHCSHPSVEMEEIHTSLGSKRTDEMHVNVLCQLGICLDSRSMWGKGGAPPRLREEEGLRLRVAEDSPLPGRSPSPARRSPPASGCAGRWPSAAAGRVPARRRRRSCPGGSCAGTAMTPPAASACPAAP